MPFAFRQNGMKMRNEIKKGPQSKGSFFLSIYVVSGHSSPGFVGSSGNAKAVLQATRGLWAVHETGNDYLLLAPGQSVQPKETLPRCRNLRCFILFMGFAVFQRRRRPAGSGSLVNAPVRADKPKRFGQKMSGYTPSPFAGRNQYRPYSFCRDAFPAGSLHCLLHLHKKHSRSRH